MTAASLSSSESFLPLRSFDPGSPTKVTCSYVACVEPQDQSTAGISAHEILSWGIHVFLTHAKYYSYGRAVLAGRRYPFANLGVTLHSPIILLLVVVVVPGVLIR